MNPAPRSVSSSAGRPVTSPSAAGIVAPSKSEPSATHAGPATCATCAACSAISVNGVSASSSPSARRNPTKKLIPTSPRRSPIARSWSSVRLRGEAHSTCAPECEATSGAALSSATSQKPRSLRCETSMTIPSSPQARTSARPASVRPGPWSGEPGKPNGTPVANALRRLHTSPSERRPAACRTSSSSRPVPIGSAPSRCSTAASPSPSRSSTRRAIRSRPPEARSIRCSSATWASASRSARSWGTGSK